MNVAVKYSSGDVYLIENIIATELEGEEFEKTKEKYGLERYKLVKSIPFTWWGLISRKLTKDGLVSARYCLGETLKDPVREFLERK